MKMKNFLTQGLTLFCLLSLSPTAFAQDTREPALDRKPAQDRQEGWIVRQTETGLVKVPAKQYFRFEGASLSGKAYTPFQAVFDQRPSRKNKSLIPVRTSFKREVLDASGYSGR